MNTAKLIKDNLPRFNGHAALYELDPPIKGENDKTHKRVIVSAAYAMFTGQETCIFPAKDDAEKIENWGELEGSFSGGMSHAEALKNAGYAII